MPKAALKARKKRKTFLLNEDLVRRTREALGVRTETEAVRTALENVVFEREVMRALERTAGKGRGHFDLSLYEDWSKALE